MKQKISDLQGITEKIIECVGCFGVVNQADLKAVLPGIDMSKISNNVRQLKAKGFIDAQEVYGMRLLSLTDKGDKKQERYNNRLWEDYQLEKEIKNNLQGKASYQRHARGKIAFMEAGADIIERHGFEWGDKEATYIDSWKVKQLLGEGEDINSARVTGICLTPEESFMVYCSEGSFTKIESCERNFKNRLKKNLPQSPSRNELKEIVIGTDINDMSGIITGKRKANQTTSFYVVQTTDRDKYFVPANNASLQLSFLLNKKFRDETVNRILENSLRDKLQGLNKISNREITQYENGEVVNLLDLNVGLIKSTKLKADDGRWITAIVLDKYEEYFSNYFNDNIELVKISSEDIEAAMNQMN